MGKTKKSKLKPEVYHWFLIPMVCIVLLLASNLFFCREENMVVFFFPNNMLLYLLFLKRDYRDDTNVSFDFTGNVSVNIGKKGFERFKEGLMFDRLCQSLGDLFKRFLQLHQNAEEKGNIDILNSINERKEGVV